MRRIIIADDSGISRHIIRRCITIPQGANWEFVEFDDGGPAFEALKSTEDVLITDLHMPRVNGLELVRRVRASPRLAGLKIVVVTSAADAETLANLIRLGARVVSKPVSREDLAAALQDISDEEAR